MAILAHPLPDAKSAPLQLVAEYYAAHLDELQQADSWLYYAKRRLAENIRDQGPIVTPTGKLMTVSTGYDYPPEMAEEFPGLAKHTVTAVVDTLEQAERILSLVTEEVPSADVGHKLTTDGKLASSLIEQGGAAAPRLREMRVPKGAKLALK